MAGLQDIDQVSGVDVPTNEVISQANEVISQVMLAVNDQVATALARVAEVTNKSLEQLSEERDKLTEMSANVLEITNNTIQSAPPPVDPTLFDPTVVKQLDSGLEEFQDSNEEISSSGDLSLLDIKYDPVTHVCSWSTDGGSTYPNTVFTAAG